MTKSCSVRQKIIMTVVIILVSAGSGGGVGYWVSTHQLRNSDQTISSPTPTTIETTKEIIPENAVINVAEKYKNNVVSIVATKDVEYVMSDPFNYFYNDPFGLDPFDSDFFSPQQPSAKPEVKKEKQEVGAGTGFVITKEGLIITNKHVVADDKAEYTVTFANNDSYQASVLTRDPTDDIAILKIVDTKGKEFTPAEFVNNKENIKVGQMVIAIGNALGQFDNTVTTGVVSGKGRDIVAGDGQGKSSNLSKLLQTDAAINPGNSGGPLVNLEGQVIGINTAIAGGAQGIGFAIPIDQNRINSILEQIQKHGKIVRPYLGVRYQLITPELNKEMKLGRDYGAWIKADNDLPAIIADTPASQAGLKGGDIVLAVNGQNIDQDHDLSAQISSFNPGDTVELTILRDGQEQKIKVILEERQE